MMRKNLGTGTRKGRILSHPPTTRMPTVSRGLAISLNQGAGMHNPHFLSVNPPRLTPPPGSYPLFKFLDLGGNVQFWLLGWLASEACQLGVVFPDPTPFVDIQDFSTLAETLLPAQLAEVCTAHGGRWPATKHESPPFALC